MALEVTEVIKGEEPIKLPFSGSLQRPWRQKEGRREGADVYPGTELYIAQIADNHGLTFKVGSGKADDRLKDMNKYRRGSQKEVLWSMKSKYEFSTVEAARAAEDYILKMGKEAGFGSSDHSEFLVGITIRRLNELYSKAIELGLQEDDLQANM